MTAPIVSEKQSARPRTLVAAAVFAVAAIVLGYVAVGQYRSEHAFAAAPACAPAGTVNASCRLMVPATVTDIVSGSGPRAANKMGLSGPKPVSGTHGFPSDDGVMAMSDPGDKVTAEVWRGRVVAVNDGLFRTFTSDAPIYRERQWSSGALAAGLLALVFLLVWAWNIRAVKGFMLVTTVRGGRAAVHLLLVTAALTAVCTALLELAVPDSPELVLLGGLFVVLAVIIGLLYWRGLRKMAAARAKTAPAA